MSGVVPAGMGEAPTSQVSTRRPCSSTAAATWIRLCGSIPITRGVMVCLPVVGSRPGGFGHSCRPVVHAAIRSRSHPRGAEETGPNRVRPSCGSTERFRVILGTSTSLAAPLIEPPVPRGTHRKMPTASVRRRISRLRRSAGLLDQIWVRTSLGKSVKARMSARAASRWSWT